MKKGLLFVSCMLMLSLPSLQAAPSQGKVVNTGLVIKSNVLQSLNTPVGLQALESFSGKDRQGKDGPMAKLGIDLSLIYHEHRNFKINGGTQVLKRPFTSSLPLARIRDEKLVIDVVASANPDNLAQDLSIFGMENISVHGRMISGLIPISSLEQIAEISTLKFARPSYVSARTGSVTSQGDAASLADDARTLYGVDGTSYWGEFTSTDDISGTLLKGTDTGTWSGKK